MILNGFDITPRDNKLFLLAAIQALTGNAEISFEGDLSDLDLTACGPPVPESDSILQRQTSEPLLDLIVLPLESDTVGPLSLALQRTGAVEAIVHVQIAKQGRLVFSAADNFHPDCVWASSDGFPRDVLQGLLDNGVIKAFSARL